MVRAGPTPFGYRRAHGKLVLDPVEAPIRQRMYALFLKHQRKKTVAEILNAEGYRTRNGAFFTGQTIGRLLTDEQVSGVPGVMDALIAKSELEKCQAILQEQKAGGGAKRKPRHLFAGLTFCVCGDKMYVPSGSHKYTCRSCKAKIHKLDLEAVYIEQIRKENQSVSIPSQYLSLFQKWSALSQDDKRIILEATTSRIDIDTERNKVTLSLVALA